MSYIYTSFPGQREPRRSYKAILKFLLFVMLIAAVIALIVVGVAAVKQMIDKSNQKRSIAVSYKQLFDNKNYLELVEKMDSELKKNPLQVEYLIYRGFSYHLLGESEKDMAKRAVYFSLALFDLRKAVAVGIPDRIAADVYFCIGKIYYYSGRSYYNQSIEYLKRSLTYGNERVDLLYVLGLVYSYIGSYEESNKVLGRSLDIEKSELVLLAMGINEFRMEKYPEAEKYLADAVATAKDPKIKEKALYHLGVILYNEKKYETALDMFNKVIELNENNADAYYYRGEIYSVYFKDTIKARSEWRKTLEIDPSHIKAYNRI